MAHFQTYDRQLPKLGTRALFELTTIMAISYAIIIALSNDPALITGVFIVWMLLYSAFGILASLAGIGLLLAFLRDHQSPWRGALIPGLLVFVCCILGNRIDGRHRIWMDQPVVRGAEGIAGDDVWFRHDQ